MTASDLINGSFRLLGILAEGETPSDAQSSDALSALNDMIDSWSNENLMIINSVREVFPLTAGKQTYTIGTSGDFNTTRPMEIQDCMVQLTGTTPNVELPVQILNQDEYDAIIIKGTTSSIARKIYYDNAFPLGTIWVWPVPQDGTTNLVLVSTKPLTTLASLTTTIGLAPGFNRALRYNLAVELAPEYGVEPSDVVVTIATRSKASIKSRNMKTQVMGLDPALVPKLAGFNWKTGGFN